METAYISIGSNIEPRKHIENALLEMRTQFENVEQSSIYESEAVGFEGDNFLNLVVKFDTQLSAGQLNAFLHKLEEIEGRERINGKAWDSRTLDLDILLFADVAGDVDGMVLPRDEILEHAHVLMPLAELISEHIHPFEGKTYQQLLAEADFNDQRIWQVKL